MLLRLGYLTVSNVFTALRLLPMGDRDKAVEIIALRHQIAVLERQLGQQRVSFTATDRALLAALLYGLPRQVLGRVRLLVSPDTVLRWHRDLIGRGMQPAPGPRAQAGHGPCVRSVCWCCAWPRRIPAGGIGGCTVNFWCWG